MAGALMRVRFGVGLPGPFYLTSGGRRRRGRSGSASTFVLIVLALAAVGAIIRWWYVALPVLAVIVVLGLLSRHGRRVRVRHERADVSTGTRDVPPAPPVDWRPPH